MYKRGSETDNTNIRQAIDKDGNIKIMGEGLKPIIENARKTLSGNDALKLQTDLNDYMIAKRCLDDLVLDKTTYILSTLKSN